MSTPTPSLTGRFGEFGGRYVPETLIRALDELVVAYEEAGRDPGFARDLEHLLTTFVGRPTPLYKAERLGAEIGHSAVYLKREDLNHTGAHKINNTIGQVLLARRMGKHRIIAETGAGQHGVATATACDVDIPVPISAAVCCSDTLPFSSNSTFANDASAPVPKSFCTHAKPTP